MASKTTTRTATTTERAQTAYLANPVAELTRRSVIDSGLSAKDATKRQNQLESKDGQQERKEG